MLSISGIEKIVALYKLEQQSQIKQIVYSRMCRLNGKEEVCVRR